MDLWIYNGKSRRRAEEAICKNCNKTFLRRKESPERLQIFCSQKCKYSSFTTLVATKCFHCSKDIIKKKSKIGTKNFCNKNCKDISSRKHYNKCLRCNADILSENKFCNSTCRHDFKYDEYIKKWLKGEENGNSRNGEDTCKYIRRFLIEEVGYKCSKCGWNKKNEKTDKVPLTINHIDGNYLNNIKSNLEVICPNCHSLTPNYCSLNKGNGRKIVKKEFIEKNTIKEIDCKQCNKKFLPQQHRIKFCSIECSAISQRKVLRPSKEELEKEIVQDKISFVALGIKYKVTDNCIKKWAKQYEIMLEPRRGKDGCSKSPYGGIGIRT